MVEYYNWTIIKCENKNKAVIVCHPIQKGDIAVSSGFLMQFTDYFWERACLIDEVGVCSVVGLVN